VLTACCALVAGLAIGAGPAQAAPAGGIPPAVDPGTPTFAGSATPIPAEPATFNPSKSMLQAIYDADVAAGGTSYWFDRILARPFSDGAGETSLLTRGRALFMYTHSPAKLGFGSSRANDNGQGGQGNGWAYRQPLAPTTPSTLRDLYTVAVSGDPLAEDTAQRVQYPSYYSAVFTRTGLSVAEKKFITDNNVAITNLTLTNTGPDPASVTVTGTAPIAATPSADGVELTGSVTTRYGLTTVFPRFSGDGFTVSGTALTREVTLAPGESTTMKVQLGAIANELPGSATDYQRFRGLDPNTAWLTQLKEYNRFWVDNVGYLDLPDKNVEKISYYRVWENRFNSFDGNIPGNDFQFPVDLEGAFGYNNQISLTVPMRMQDLEYFRDPLYSYGPWLSQGEESGCQAFHDNPGNTGNWNNTYEQWTASQAWQSYLVHGGPPAVVHNLARYAECDVKGTLAKFDTNHNDLIQYSAGTLPGNDADSVAFGYHGTRPQDRTETSLWYSGAKAAAAEYTLLGNTAKAAEMNAIADRVKTAVLGLWAAGPVTNSPEGPGVVCTATGPRVAGRNGNALRLCGQNESVNMPTGILSGLSDFTISASVNPGANTAWSRVFDFGTGTTVNMFLTVSAGGGPIRFAITTGGGGVEQQINGTSTLPLNTWSHVAVTLSGNTGTLYVNGSPVASNPNITLRPSNLGNTGNNWIGRSQYNDPFLTATVDDFNIYDHALTGTEVATLAGGGVGAGNVASYRFDEASGATATDSSGAGRDATVVSNPPPPKPTITCPGKVFLQRDLTTGNLVCWKDQQNFAPFIDGIPPNTDDYKQALRYYADRNEFGIMPIYTANQADKAAEIACGLSCSPAAAGQSNNFSNINATLQARLYSRALRDYPSQFITPEMYRKLIEWLSWNEFVGGDNRFPDNNEFFFNWNPTTRTLGRSFIHHDVLGSFNWMFTEDLAGLRARLDDTLELWPIDLGYDHFTLNNLNYHGSNLTVVWQQPGGPTFYPTAPAGYSVYLDGARAFTVAGLAHLTWNSATGAVSVLDGSGTAVRFNAARPLKAATEVSLGGNARLTEDFQRAGVDLSGTSGASINLSRGTAATASFTTTSPATQLTSPANAVDGFTTSAPPVTSGAFVGTNPIWGDLGSPNAQDWLQVDLAAPTRVNNVKAYFYNNKAFGVGGNTYREPAAYTVQYFDGSAWVDVPGQVKSPATPMPNYNEVSFPPLVTQQLRLLMTRPGTFAVGVKELQVFDLESVLGQVDSVKAYVAALPVSGGVKNALTVKLTAVAAQFRSGKKAQAVNTVTAFTNQVTSLAADNVLTAEQATFLLASGTAITGHILE
jgi:hypothetical protein